MKTINEKGNSSQEGFVLIAALFVLVIVSLAGVYALTNANTELKIVRNTQQMTLEFYEAEAGLFEAVEFVNVWMTDEMLSAKEDVPSDFQHMDTLPDPFPPDPTIAGDPFTAFMDIRPIRDSVDATTEVAGYSEEAYDYPLQPHLAAPPAGSGFSMTNFQIRRYAVTSASRTGNTVLQAGAWKIFNKYE